MARRGRNGVTHTHRQCGGPCRRSRATGADDRPRRRVCFLVRAIDELGFLWLANGQGWQRNAGLRNSFTIGQRVKVLARKGDVPGIIGAATGHLAALTLHEPQELTWNDFWVDTGLSRNELLALGVSPGTRVIWDAQTERFGRHVVGKALDDRVLLAVLTEVLRRVPVAARLRSHGGLLCARRDRRGRRQRAGCTHGIRRSRGA